MTVTDIVADKCTSHVDIAQRMESIHSRINKQGIGSIYIRPTKLRHDYMQTPANAMHQRTMIHFLAEEKTSSSASPSSGVTVSSSI